MPDQIDTAPLLRAARERLARNINAGRIQPEDHLEALPDLVLAKLRGRSDESLHPIAAAAFERGDPVRVAIERASDIDIRGGDFHRGIAATDFAWISATALTTFVGESVPAAAVRRVAARRSVTNLQPVTLGSVTVDEESVTAAGTSGLREMKIALPEASTTGRPLLWLVRVLAPRTLVVNDALDVLGEVAAAAGRALMRREAAEFAAALTADPAVFGTTLWGADNTGATAGISVDALSSGVEKLAAMVNAAGQRLDAIAAYWLVPPSAAASAKILATAAGGWPEVIPTSHLPGGYSILMADPAEVPAVVRLALGSDAPTVTPIKPPADYDGLAFEVALGTGWAITSRAMVRIPTS